MVDKTPTEEDQAKAQQDAKAHELTAVDQTKQNVPIDPDMADMLDLLEQKMRLLTLDDTQCDLLRDGFKQERF